jgi:hypothetical protein
VLVGNPRFAAHGVVVVATAPDSTWLVYCQAREDTDGDGEVAVGVGVHGDFFGDRMRAWYSGPDGRESPIDDYVDAEARSSSPSANPPGGASSCRRAPAGSIRASGATTTVGYARLALPPYCYDS